MMTLTEWYRQFVNTAGKLQMSEQRNPKKRLVIIGAGGHATSIANIALACGYSIECFIDKHKTSESLLGTRIAPDIQNIKNPEDHHYAIGIGDNHARQKLYENLTAEKNNLIFPPLIHPSATISFFTEIGEGTVIMPNSCIGPNSKVGKFCIINTHASLDHDCLMGDYSSLAPSATTGGKVIIGERTAICIASTIKHGLEIGSDCVVGASSLALHNISNNTVSYGIPAKEIRRRYPGEKYL